MRLASTTVLGVVLAVIATHDARAQSACAQLGVDCSHPTSSGRPPADPAAAAAAQAAAEAQMREQIRLELDAAQREGAAARDRALVRANDAGRKAALAGNLALAIAYFEAELAIDPSNELATRNLHDARERQALERARRELAAEQRQRAIFLAAGTHAPVPLPGSGAVVIGEHWPGELPPALPGAFDLCKTTFEFLRDRAGEAVMSNARDGIDVMTPEGLFVRLQANTVILANKVTDWITAAANGTMTVGEANLLTERGVSVLLNVGHPGKFLHEMIEAGSAEVAAVNALTPKAEEGLASTAAAIGATTLHGVPSGTPFAGDTVLWQATFGEFKRAGQTATELRNDVTRYLGLVDKWAKGPSAEPPPPQPAPPPP